AAEKQQLLDELQARRKATTTKASQTAPQTPSYRCFLGLEVSPSIREALWRESLQIRQQVPNNHWRWIPPENYHLTLAFLGDVSLDGIEQLQKSLTCKR